MTTTAQPAPTNPMHPGRAIAAGLIATATMTALLLIEPSIDLPRIAIGQILSTSLALTSAHLGLGTVGGWLVAFAVGVIFALAYGAFFARRLPGGPFIRGVLYGVLLFVLAQVVFMPSVGGGFFSRGDLHLLLGSLLGHVVYGGTLGWIYQS